MNTLYNILQLQFTVIHAGVYLIYSRDYIDGFNCCRASVSVTGHHCGMSRGSPDVVMQTSQCTVAPIALVGCTDCAGRLLVVMFASLHIIVIIITIIIIISQQSSTFTRDYIMARTKWRLTVSDCRDLTFSTSSNKTLDKRLQPLITAT